MGLFCLNIFFSAWPTLASGLFVVVKLSYTGFDIVLTFLSSIDVLLSIALCRSGGRCVIMLIH